MTTELSPKRKRRIDKFERMIEQRRSQERLSQEKLKIQVNKKIFEEYKSYY